MAPQSMRLGFGSAQALVTCPTGANHLDKGLHCQDACSVAQHFYRGVPYSVMVVADGHGSAKYSRSDIGAHLAVEAAREAASELVMALASLRAEHPDEWHRLIDNATSRLGSVLVKRWLERVSAHASDHPEVGIEPGDAAWLGRYGSTVALAILYDDDWLITGSLGDSALLAVSRQGGQCQVQELVANPELEVGLGTDSLISERAPYMCRVEVTSMLHSPPAMLLLTTDGLTDSLEDLSDVLGSIYDNTMRYGMEWLQRVLPRQLAIWSAHGVGDDMGCIVFFPLQPYVDQQHDSVTSSSRQSDAFEQEGGSDEQHSH